MIPGGNLNKLLKQAQKMQEEMAKIQEGLKSKSVESSSGGGMVTTTVNGQQEVLSIKIDPEVLSSQDVEMLQDLILASVNEGLRKSKELIQEEMSKVTGGLKIPGLF